MEMVIHLVVILAFAIVLTIFISEMMVPKEMPSKEEVIKLMPEERVYQGPVPQGYDLEHFRKTGETILLNG